MALSNYVEVVHALDYASGNADREGEIIDTIGADGVLFVVDFSSIAENAVTSVLVQHGDVANLSDAATVTGTSTSTTDNTTNQVFAIDVGRLTKRYYRVKIDKDASNATAETAVALVYNRESHPPTDDDDVTVTTVGSA